MLNRFLPLLSYVLASAWPVPVYAMTPEAEWLLQFSYPYEFDEISRNSSYFAEKMSDTDLQKVYHLLEKASTGSALDSHDILAVKASLRIVGSRGRNEDYDIVQKILFSSENFSIWGEAGIVLGSLGGEKAIGDLERAAHLSLDQGFAGVHSSEGELLDFLTTLSKIGGKSAKESFDRLSGRIVELQVKREGVDKLHYRRELEILWEEAQAKAKPVAESKELAPEPDKKSFHTDPANTSSPNSDLRLFAIGWGLIGLLLICGISFLVHRGKRHKT